MMNHPEDLMQTALFRWANLEEGKYPDLKLMFHCPNGGSRNVVEATKLKGMGVKRGVPDVILPVPRGGYHGLFVELKAGKNRPTQEQTEWLMALGRNGYRTAVCYTLDEAIREIKAYLGLLEARNENTPKPV